MARLLRSENLQDPSAWSPDIAAQFGPAMIASRMNQQTTDAGKVGSLRTRKVAGNDGKPYEVTERYQGNGVWQADGNPVPVWKPDTLSPEAESQRLRLAEAGRPSTEIINTPENKGLVNYEMDLYRSAEDKTKLLNELHQFRDVASQADTGTFAPVTTAFKAGLKGLGINPETLGLSDDVGMMQFLTSAQNKFALRLRNPDSGFGLTGNTSDRDVRFLKDSVAGIDKTPESNLIMLDTMIANTRREATLEEEKANYISENRSLRGWREYRRKWIEQNPLFTPEEQSRITALSERGRARKSGGGAPELGTPAAAAKPVPGTPESDPLGIFGGAR